MRSKLCSFRLKIDEIERLNKYASKYGISYSLLARDILRAAAGMDVDGLGLILNDFKGQLEENIHKIESVKKIIDDILEVK